MFLAGERFFVCAVYKYQQGFSRKLGEKTYSHISSYVDGEGKGKEKGKKENPTIFVVTTKVSPIQFSHFHPAPAGREV